MLDFSTLKALTVPEGSVNKITVDGELKWVKPEAEITYTPIEYIQFTGSQRIDTGIICDQNTKIRLMFTTDTSSAKYLYGVRDSANEKSVTAYLTKNGAWRFGNTYASFSPAQGQVYSVVVNKDGVYIDGTKYKYGSTVKNFQAIASLTLGSARTSSGALALPQFIGKLYFFRVDNGNNVLINYQPVLRSDGVYGFLDKVSGEFRGSDTSTPFYYDLP